MERFNFNQTHTICANRNYQCGHQTLWKSCLNRGSFSVPILLCPDVYNSSAPSYGWVFSFPIHPHGVLAERQNVSREECMFPSHPLTPHPISWLIHSHIPSAKSNRPVCVLYPWVSMAVPLYSDKGNRAFCGPNSGEMWWEVMGREEGLA